MARAALSLPRSPFFSTPNWFFLDFIEIKVNNYERSLKEMKKNPHRYSFLVYQMFREPQNQYFVHHDSFEVSFYFLHFFFHAKQSHKYVLRLNSKWRFNFLRCNFLFWQCRPFLVMSRANAGCEWRFHKCWIAFHWMFIQKNFQWKFFLTMKSWKNFNDLLTARFYDNHWNFEYNISMCWIILRFLLSSFSTIDRIECLCFRMFFGSFYRTVFKK